MFEFLFFIFEFFRNRLFSETLNNPLRIEWDDWLPDFAKWFGKFLDATFAYVKDVIKWLASEIYRFIKIVVDTIKNFAESVGQFFVTLWTYLKNFFQAWLNYFGETLEWVGDCLYDFYEYLSDTVTYLWDLVTKTVETCWEALQDLFWYIGKWLWEFFLGIGDSLIGLLVEMLEWFFDTLLPKMDMPEGFDQGVTSFIQFGMLMNDILPLRESLSLFALYIAIVVVVGVVHFILKHLPFIGG